LSGAFLEALLVHGAEHHVDEDVVGDKGSVGFELSAPVPFFVLKREKVIAGTVERVRESSLDIVNFTEANMRCRFGGDLFHVLLQRSLFRRGRGRADGFHDLGRQGEAYILWYDFHFLQVRKTTLLEISDRLFH
jgi:hypothetical protein